MNSLEILTLNILGLKDILILTLTKNPYSWLLSLYRKPYHQTTRNTQSFETFLLAPWETIARENCGIQKINNPIELWNIKNRAYLDLGNEFSIMNITAESLLENPEAILLEIAKILSLELKDGEFVNYQKPAKVDAFKTNDYYKDYYLNEWKLLASR